MYVYKGSTLHHIMGQIAPVLVHNSSLDVGEWQSQKTTDPLQRFREMRDVVLEMPIPLGQERLQLNTCPNLPWAEDHFQERVGGKPLNPPPSAAWWPFAQNGHADHTTDKKFSHTYPERYWPRQAGDLGNIYHTNRGIRYRYGDLADVVALLIRSPQTRQAYLPVWFPEDTGATEGQRVPCTLGYHFQARYGVLSVSYFMRSCDFVRHFSDDVYMTGRLVQWMCEKVSGFEGGPKMTPGKLVMHISNLHAFEGDDWTLSKMADDYASLINQTRDGHYAND